MGVFFTDANTGTAVGWYGTILRTTTGGTVWAEDRNSNDTPRHFSLRQNYPNPFNPGTTIAYSIPRPSFVTVTVYDLLGRVVATLVNGERTAGTYSTRWDANGISSGVYFYTLRAHPEDGERDGAFVQTRKLILVR
jgi:hypothetical protein